MCYFKTNALAHSYATMQIYTLLNFELVKPNSLYDTGVLNYGITFPHLA